MCGFPGEERLDELEVADGDGVELEEGGALVEADGFQVLESALLGLAEIVDEAAGGDGGGVVAGEAEAVEGEEAEVLAEEREGVLGGEDPVFDGGFGADGVEGFGRLRVGCAGEERGGLGEAEAGPVWA